MWNLQHSRGSVISMTTAEQHDARTGTSPSQASIRWIRIIPVALIMYTIAFIDRTNISLALPHISWDLHLHSHQAGTVAGIFFWGDLALLVAGGSLPFLWLAVWLVFIQDHPSQASFLPEDERTLLVETLRRESSELEGSEKIPYFRALLRPQVFLLAAIYFCFVSGQMGLLFWLPSAMGKFRMLSSLSTGILYTIPFIVGAISVLVISRHSDKMHERRFHAAGAMLFGETCILLAVATIPHSLLIAFAFIALSGVGAYGPMGAFWAIPTETLSSRIVGSVMGFVNAIGNLGAYFAPLIVGYLNKRTGSFLAGFTYLGMITLVGSGLTMLVKAAPKHAEVGS